nr:MAG TPA: hypothetical protein [Caudoviricetes sp.]
MDCRDNVYGGQRYPARHESELVPGEQAED